MEDQVKDRVKALKKKRRNRSFLPFAIVSVVIIALTGSYFYYQNQENTASITGEQQPQSLENTAPDPKPVPQATEAEATIEVTVHEDEDPIGDIISSNQDVEPVSLQQTSTPADEPVSVVIQPETSEPERDPYQDAVDRINRFYQGLDNKRYIKEYRFNAPSEDYFSGLMQKALDNPPIVSGETDDLFNVLKNTAHFFRVVGKKNITVIKSILHEEKQSYEHVLADYYLLSQKPEYLEKAFALQVTDEALLDYAGFFLNTMGGRLYLFRRDSVSRMLVSYYAILMVEQANQEARNVHGIDIKPTVVALIEEMESSNATLQMKDKYLDTLYSIQERY